MAIKTYQLSDEEREAIYIALSIRCGFIETNTIQRAKDLVKSGNKEDINILSIDQMRAIIFNEDLMKKLF